MTLVFSFYARRILDLRFIDGKSATAVDTAPLFLLFLFFFAAEIVGVFSSSALAIVDTSAVDF
jgi:hypothetical protein